jgi:hypothetical protein
VRINVRFAKVLPLKQRLIRCRGGMEQAELQSKQIREVLLLQLARA